jgi:23S rRNA (cytosine1962-C5)-methyltransferase
VRPLVAHAGWLVVINNALFLSGADFMAELESLCSSGHLNIERTITIPIDVTGYPDTIITPPPADPAPFNHPTKIAILKVFRKDSRK